MSSLARVRTRASVVVALLLAVLATLGSVAVAGPASAGQPGPRSLSGTLTTPDGKPLAAPVLVSLYSWFPAGDPSYPTPQSSVLISPGDDLHFTLTAQGAGYYAIRARPLANAASYLTTWYASGEAIAPAYGDPGVIFVDDHLTPQSGKDIVLRQGVEITGTVRGSTGAPLADTAVDAQRWNSAGQVEAIPGTGGGLTDADGRGRALPARRPQQ